MYNFKCLINLFIFSLQKKTPFPECMVYHFTMQLLAIVSEMHRCRILHGNTQPKVVKLRFPKSPVRYEPDLDWTVDAVLDQKDFNFLKVDCGNSIDLELYPDQTTFMHQYEFDQIPEMLDAKPWIHQVLIKTG